MTAQRPLPIALGGLACLVQVGHTILIRGKPCTRRVKISILVLKFGAFFISEGVPIDVLITIIESPEKDLNRLVISALRFINSVAVV